jgi:hypothetical protein
MSGFWAGLEGALGLGGPEWPESCEEGHCFHEKGTMHEIPDPKCMDGKTIFDSRMECCRCGCSV